MKHQADTVYLCTCITEVSYRSIKRQNLDWVWSYIVHEIENVPSIARHGLGRSMSSLDWPWCWDYPSFTRTYKTMNDSVIIFILIPMQRKCRSFLKYNALFSRLLDEENIHCSYGYFFLSIFVYLLFSA